MVVRFVFDTDTPCRNILHCYRDNLGTVSDHSLRESHASVCIVRPTGSSMGQATFLFATDGSHAAALAFCMLCTM